jgi:hypothetical protein
VALVRRIRRIPPDHADAGVLCIEAGELAIEYFRLGAE